MPYVPSQHGDLTEIGVQLECLTPNNRPCRADLYASWVKFRGFTPQDIDFGRVVAAREALIRTLLDKNGLANEVLDREFSTLVRNALPELIKQRAAMGNKGYNTFTVVLAPMNKNLRSDRAKAEGSCVILPFDEFAAAVKDGSILNTLKDVFYAQNESLMLHMLDQLEARKIKELERFAGLWMEAHQPDGSRFGYAFSATEDTVYVIVNGIGFSENGKPNVIPGFLPARARDFLLDMPGLGDRLRNLPFTLVNADINPDSKFGDRRRFIVEENGVPRELTGVERNVLAANFTRSLDYLPLALTLETQQQNAPRR
jgi:hypothetical protein